MSWEVDLAKEFKKRNNKHSIGACIGTCLSVSPFTASIFGGEILLDSENSYICSQLLERKSEFKLTGQAQHSGSLNASCHLSSHSSYSASGPMEIEGEMELKEVLKPNDYILVIPSEDSQKFFIVDILKGVV